jgi:energy-coupling factor transport system ATP-binding protein
MSKNEEYDIVLDNVTFSYEETKEPAIKDVSLKIKKGEIVLITGPGGAGKSTLCCCMNGLIPHFHNGSLAGKIYVKGVDTQAITIGQLTTQVGLVFQDPESQLFNFTVEDEIAFGPENMGLEPNEINSRVADMIKRVRLEGFNDRNPLTLSGGEKQACAIASILSMSPSILVLDEPTSNLDPIGTQSVLKLIMDLAKREKKTMIIVEHNLADLVTQVDRMIVVKDGSILFNDTPKEVFKNIKQLKDIGINLPQSTQLLLRLKENGILESDNCMTMEDTYQAIISNLDSKRFKNAKKYIVNKQETTDKKPIIQVKNLGHTYEDGKVVALHGIDLDIYPGEFIAVIGQNGSGKTTLVKHFNGLLKPTTGEVIVKGVDTRTTTVATLARDVGYCFQNPDHQIVKSIVREEIGFGPKNLKVPEEEIAKRVEEITTKLNIHKFLDEDPHELSKGNKARVNLAGVLAMKPEVLIVDEPLTGQDFKEAKAIMDLLNELNNDGKTIIIITHEMMFAAEYARKIIVMNKGEMLYKGNPKQVYAQKDILERTSLIEPEVTQLGYRLCGVPDITTMDELYNIITKAEVNA